jgi:Prokaryotic N-terminal methylation motif
VTVNRPDPEGGFTLIEMILTMLLLLVVIAPISSAMFLGLHTEADVQTRLAESNGANIAASYFAGDVQQALLIATNTNESPACGGATGPVKLLLTQASLQSSVSYFVDPTDPTVLRRRACSNGAVVGPPTGVPVLHNLSSVPDPQCNGVGCTWTLLQQVSGKSPYSTTLVGTKRIQ